MVHRRASRDRDVEFEWLGDSPRAAGVQLQLDNLTRAHASNGVSISLT